MQITHALKQHHDNKNNRVKVRDKVMYLGGEVRVKFVNVGKNRKLSKNVGCLKCYRSSKCRALTESTLRFSGRDSTLFWYHFRS